MRREITAALAGIVLLAWSMAALAESPASSAPSQTSSAAAAAMVSAPVATLAPAVQPVPPAPQATGPNTAQTLDLQQQTLERMQSQVAITSDDSRLAAMGRQALSIETAANQAAAAANTQLQSVDAAIRKIDANRHHRPTAAEQVKLAPLQAQQQSLQAQLSEAQGVIASAGQTFSTIAEHRRESFSDRVLAPSPSPLSPDFWTGLVESADADMDRLGHIAARAASVAAQASEPKAGLGLAFGIVLAVVILFPVRVWLERFGRRQTSASAAPPGLRRTANAVWIAIVDVATPTLAAMVVHLAAQWGGLLSRKADAVAGAGVVAVVWAAAILALGRALATDPDPGRRMLDLPEAAVGRVRLSLWAVAVITGCGFLVTRLNYVVGSSVAATIATNCVLSLAYGAVAGLILVGFGHARAPDDAEGAAEHADPVEEARSPVWTLISLALTVAIIVIVGAVFAGYSTLAALVSNQIFWLSILAAVTYLLLRLIDDACAAMFRKQGGAARALRAVFRLRNSTISQMGVLLSAGLQLLIVIGAISLALTPFGQSGELFLTHLSQLGGVIRIGSATISPTAIATGLGTFAIGMALVHLVQGWVERRYLPVTEWDAGLRNSVITGVGYLGVGVALLCAMAAMGLGFQQIALVASALSVGIGFGLQQVVQNFVSGVILLIERPVKVGDWINVNNVEGDVRRIRVRATEIQTFDRSTVIVPNSDLITKVVQNRTLGDPRGRIQMPISIASPVDAQRATDLILQAAKAKSQVLSEPAPAVFIDSLGAGGAVNFNCFLYVRNQRDVYRTRSELYFDIIQIFQQNDVAFVGASGPTNIVVEPGPTMKNMLAAATNGSGSDKAH